MTKVYAIWHDDYLEHGHPYLIGLYSTKDKARKALKKYADMDADNEYGYKLVWDSPDIYRIVTDKDCTLESMYIETKHVDREV